MHLLPTPQDQRKQSFQSSPRFYQQRQQSSGDLSTTPALPEQDRIRLQLPFTSSLIPEELIPNKAVTFVPPAYSPFADTVYNAPIAAFPPLPNQPSRSRPHNDKTTIMNVASVATQRERFLQTNSSRNHHPPTSQASDIGTISNKKENTRYMAELRHTIFSRVKDDWTYSAPPSVRSTTHAFHQPSFHPESTTDTTNTTDPMDNTSSTGQTLSSPLQIPPTIDCAPPETPLLPPGPRAPSYLARTYSPPASRSSSPDASQASYLLSSSQSPLTHDSAIGIAHWTARRDAWTLAVQTATSPAETLLPVPPPILPASNPARKAIIPNTYKILYTKVVIKGLAPSVPINLSDVTKALVEGWKEDGEWPPKGTAPEPSLAGARKSGAKKAAPEMGEENTTNHGVARGVGKVKSVLGLGGPSHESEGPRES